MAISIRHDLTQAGRSVFTRKRSLMKCAKRKFLKIRLQMITQRYGWDISGIPEDEIL